MASHPRQARKTRPFHSGVKDSALRRRQGPDRTWPEPWIDDPSSGPYALPSCPLISATARSRLPGDEQTTLCPVETHQVIKRLKPGQAGARGLTQRFGPALVCVRYRESDTGDRRFTTIELVVDQRPARRQPMVRVQIRYDDPDTRRQAMALGAQWDESERTWRMPRRGAIKLGLLTNRPKPKAPE